MQDPSDANFFEAVITKSFEEVERLFPFASIKAQLLYITSHDFTPLHHANSAGMVRCCISSGVDVNVKNQETDETPLLTAVKLNKPSSIIKELLKSGASVEVRNKHTLNTPLNQAMHTVECRPENVQALLEYGADANTVNKYGVVPLHLACQNFKGDVKIVEQLLKWGALVNCKNSEGHTPLSIALENRYCTAELLSLLLKFDAMVNLENIKTALTDHSSYLLNIMPQLLWKANFTSSDAWRDILDRLFRSRADSESISKCRMLVVKYSFLHCDDHWHDALVDFLLTSMKRSHYLHNLMKNHTRGNISFTKLKWYAVEEIEELRFFADNCFSEIKYMKTHILKNNTTMYKMIMSKSPKGCLGEILEELKRNLCPIYSDIILNKIKRAALVDKLIWQEFYTVVQHGDIVRRIVLDAFSVSSIAEYLGEDEIKNCVDAFSNPSNGQFCFWDKLVKIEASLSKMKQI